MAFSVAYKKLFELRIIHPFFLKDEEYFIERDSNYLEEDLYNISDELDIQPILNCNRVLDNQKMLFRKTPWGFVVLVEAEEDTDGMFKPKIPLSSTTTFRFRVRLKNKYFDNITNTRLKPNVKGIFHFDNFRNKSDANSSTLSRPPAKLFSREYEMGEITEGNNRSNKSTVVNEAGDGIWDEINPYYDYVTYNDRLLVSSKFQYRFANAPVNPVFTLHSELDALVEEITETNETPIKIKDLDLSTVPNGWYTLKVTDEETSYIDEKEIYINDKLYDPFTWAVIEINNSSDNPSFKFLNEEGVLPDSSNPVVFEVRPLNRATYWKYIENEENYFITEKPMPLSRFSKPIEVGSEMVANPSQYDLKSDENYIYSEIYLQKINI